MADTSKGYEDWKHCITVQCKIKLTPDYVAKRIAALNNERDPMTARFIKLYGDAHLKRTIGWFEQASAELAGAG